MGLDMYLTGETYFCSYGDYSRPSEEGFEVKGHNLDLGYWRKHPDLHGYIVENFNDGNDDCKPIYLGVDQLNDIIHAIVQNALPKTEGFFLGESQNDEEQKSESIEIFRKAIKWLESDIEGVAKDVYYVASW